MKRDILWLQFWGLTWMTLNERLEAIVPRRPTIQEIQERFAYCDWLKECRRKGRDIIDLSRPLTFTA